MIKSFSLPVIEIMAAQAVSIAIDVELILVVICVTMGALVFKAGKALDFQPGTFFIEMTSTAGRFLVLPFQRKVGKLMVELDAFPAFLIMALCA